jgi:hypothetical protein
LIPLLTEFAHSANSTARALTGRVKTAGAGAYLTPESIKETARALYSAGAADWDRAASEVKPPAAEPAPESPGEYIRDEEGRPSVRFEEPESADGASSG